MERVGPYVTNGGNVWTSIEWSHVLELAATISQHRKLFITSVFVGAVDEEGLDVIDCVCACVRV